MRPRKLTTCTKRECQHQEGLRLRPFFFFSFLFFSNVALMILSIKQKQIMDMESRRVVGVGREEEMGWMGSLGLVDANYSLFYFILSFFRATPVAYGSSTPTSSFMLVGFLTC